MSSRAGVSVGTVSNVLNAPYLVSSDTRTRVLAAIADLDYHPNRTARSLQAQKTGLIGYRLPDPGVSPALDVFLHQLVVTAAGHGLGIALFTSRPGQGETDAYREMIRIGAVDGFILSETNYQDRRVDLLTDLGFPFATFGRTVHQSPHPWVDVDGAAGMAAVVGHLVELGHRRIALMAWPEGSETGDTRVEGFKDGMATAGLAVDGDLVIRTANGFDEGRVAGGNLLDRTQPPTAIVTVQDELALGAMSAVVERDLRPGRRLAITGFDDSQAAALSIPGLTSVRQPFDEVAEMLVGLLVDRLAGQGQPPRTVLLAPRLVTRASTLGAS
ncbi:MAG: LacI family DNA-binding transcriptional regulator [Actinomycetota bacterium]